MSVRLNNSIRDSIVNRVAAAAFDKKMKAAQAKVLKAFPKFRKTLLGKHAKAFDSLPDEWQRKHRFSAMRIDTPVGVHYLNLPETITMPEAGISVSALKRKDGSLSLELLTRFRAETTPEFFPDHDAAFEVLRPSLEELITLHIERHVMQSEVRAVVESVTTFKRLYEVWPELIEIIPPPDDNRRATSKAMTVNIDKLNEKIPLPQKKPK